VGQSPGNRLAGELGLDLLAALFDRAGCADDVLDYPLQRRDQDDAALAAPLKNASKSALIWSAFVVGMPCGKPL
jgi:hypothetical protein